uniref:Uncharacterized protein n=1 Tax=Anguilla anguilla TaxID=7936 RepID=A0A0E9PNP3_ANGAN
MVKWLIKTLSVYFILAITSFLLCHGNRTNPELLWRL